MRNMPNRLNAVLAFQFVQLLETIISHNDLIEPTNVSNKLTELLELNKKSNRTSTSFKGATALMKENLRGTPLEWVICPNSQDLPAATLFAEITQAQQILLYDVVKKSCTDLQGNIVHLSGKRRVGVFQQVLFYDQGMIELCLLVKKSTNICLRGVYVILDTSLQHSIDILNGYGLQIVPQSLVTLHEIVEMATILGNVPEELKRNLHEWMD